MPIKAVIWDMGGVLLHMGDETPRQELAIEFGVPLKKIYWAIFDSPSAQAATVGNITVKDHWRNVGRILDIPEQKTPGFLRRFWGVDKIDRQAIDFIYFLHKYFKTGLLSNAWDNLRDLFEHEWRIANAFDDMIISAEVGMAKPDPQIYRLAVERLGVNPGETVFIDDVLENVQAARGVGLVAVQYQSRSQALTELQNALLSANGTLPGELKAQFKSLIQNANPIQFDLGYLVQCQVGLEYQLDPDGRLAPITGSTEKACYLVHRFLNTYLSYFSNQLPARIINELEKIGPQAAFEAPGEILRALDGVEYSARSEPFLTYTFRTKPSEAEFPLVRENNGRFEVLIDGRPVSWAWSVRENEHCAEVAVETLPEHRQRGYARQVTAAWGNTILCQGRTPFFSHAETNLASAALARSLGLLYFSTCVGFE